MAEYQAGYAFIQLLPSGKGFEAKTQEELKGVNPTVDVLLVPKLDPTALPKSEQGGKESGSRFADAFDREVQSRISAALKSLPDAKVGADATDADAKIAELRAQLDELSSKKIGVDITADEALAKVDEVRVKLDELSRNDPSIQVRVDAADAASKLAAIDESVRKLDGKNVVLHVQVDEASAAAAEAQLKAAQANTTNGGAAAAGGGAGIGTGGLIAGGIALGAGAASAASLLVIPAAFAAIGAAAERSNAQVKQSTDALTLEAKQVLQQGFAPLIPAITGFEGQAKSTLDSLKPAFTQAATATAPLITALGSSLLQAVHEGVSGSIPILQQLQPVAKATGDAIVQVERGIGGFFQNLNVGVAAQGMTALGNAVKDILPVVGTLLTDLAPLGTALIGVVGPAVKALGQDFVVLKPLIDATGAVISALTPAIALAAPPVLAASVAVKLLSGSFTDFGGAASKISSIWQDANGAFDRGQSTLNSLASVVGVNTKSARDAAVADAELAVTKANLVKAAAEEAAAAAATAAGQGTSAKAALAASEAEIALAVATKEASAAEEQLAAASTASAFSFGPLGIALAVVGGALALVGLNSSKAAAPTSDLTQQLIKLGQAAPGAASGILAQDPALSSLVSKLPQARASVDALTQAYAGGAGTLQTYTNSLSAQHNSLGNTTIGLRQVGSGYQEASGTAAQTFVSIKYLTDQVNRHNISLSDLPKNLRDSVNAYNAQNDIIGQLNISVPQLRAQQQAQAQVTQLSSEQQGQASITAGFLGVTLQSVTQAYQDYAAGVTYAIPASQQMSESFLAQTVAIDQAKLSVTNYFKGADQSAQQAGQALTDAGQSATQAAQSVADAQHSLAQAGQAVADAQHSQAQAAQAVTDAEHAQAQAHLATAAAAQGVVLAERAVGDALANVTIAQNSVTKAEVADTQAQVALSQARQQAAADLRALNLQLNDQVASEQQSRVSLFDAQRSAAAYGVDSSNAQAIAGQQVTLSNEAQVKAAIALIQAQNSLADTLNSGQDLRTKVSAANAAGIEGAQGVISAQSALASANDQVVSSEQALVKAQQAVTDAQANVVKAQQAVTDAAYNEQKAGQAVADAKYNEQKAGQAVTDAKYNEQKAAIAVTDAQYNEQKAGLAVTQAQQNLQTATDAASRSLDLHTEAGLRNLAMLLQLHDQLYKNEAPQQAANDLIAATAKAFGISTDAAAGFLKQENLIPKDFQFNVTGVASTSLDQLNQAYSQIIASGRTPGGGAFRAVPKAAGGPIEGHSPSPTADNIPIMATAGEYVMPVHTVQRYGAGTMDAIRSGRVPAGALRGYAAGGLVDGEAQALGLSGIGAAYQTGVDTLTIMGFPAPASLPKYVAPTVAATSPGGGQIAYNGPTGVAQWAPQILQVLSMLGQPASWLGTVERRMNQESGGNPTIVNRWDSNWIAGTPSVGLMQVIGPTFRSNAGPFANTGPFEYGTSVDPLANIYAGVHYAIGRYGSLAALNQPGGYAEGGLVEVPHAGTFDSGGFLPPGLSTVYNGLGAWEPLTPPDRSAAIASGGGSPSGGEFTGTLYLDSGQLMGVVRGEIQSASHATGTAIYNGTR